MTRFVLDNSVVMRWFTPSSNQSDRHYADRVLKSMNEADVLMPGLWHLDASNAFLAVEKMAR